MYETINADNVVMYAIRHYDNPHCVDEQEFLDDMKRFKYLKRLFRKYDTTKELKSRLIINHIIVLSNVFGVDAATTLLFFKIDRQHWSILKTILVFLHHMPEEDMTDIRINQKVMAELGKI